MASSVLIFGLLISVVGINLVQSSTINLAYGKRVLLSSNHALYPGSNAVNGILSDFAQTGIEDNPWLRIDLGSQCSINSIAIFARSDCCAHELHDLQIAVGLTLNRMIRCDGYVGPVQRNGEQINIGCPSSTVARYVELKIGGGNNNVLAPAEVKVFGNSSCMYY